MSPSLRIVTKGHLPDSRSDGSLGELEIFAMPIRLNPDTSLRKEIRRVGKKRVRSAMNVLRTVSENPDEAVHKARKDLKKLRALLRLVKDGLGESRYKRENRALRDVARGLADFRDATVRMALVEALRERMGEDAPVVALGMAEERVRGMHGEIHSDGALEDAAKDARHALKRAKQRIRYWPLDHADGFALFRDGLRDSYASGRLACERCLIHPSAGNFHEWRKQCKYLRYQLRFLHHAAPEKMDHLIRTLRDLTDRLGDDHDQDVLAETLEPLAGTGVALKELATIHGDLEKHHRKLMDKCLSTGRTFFISSAEDFVTRIEGWWDRALQESERPVS